MRSKPFVKPLDKNYLQVKKSTKSLPIIIHTKFIEDNDFVFRSSIDFLIPNHIKNKYGFGSERKGRL